MAVSYKKLFHLMIDKEMTNAELMDLAQTSLPESSETIIFLSIPLRRSAKPSNVGLMIF